MLSGLSLNLSPQTNTKLKKTRKRYDRPGNRKHNFFVLPDRSLSLDWSRLASLVLRCGDADTGVVWQRFLAAGVTLVDGAGGGGGGGGTAAKP